MRYQDIISMEPGKRGGKPCIRSMRITVYDRAAGIPTESDLDTARQLYDTADRRPVALAHEAVVAFESDPMVGLLSLV